MDYLPAIHPPSKLRLLLAPMRCGSCGDSFIADPATVPVLKAGAVCRPCWDRACHLRMALGLPPWRRRTCYPADGF